MKLCIHFHNFLNNSKNKDPNGRGFKDKKEDIKYTLERNRFNGRVNF
jgi:hypothetical protein